MRSAAPWLFEPKLNTSRLRERLFDSVIGVTRLAFVAFFDFRGARLRALLFDIEALHRAEPGKAARFRELQMAWS